MANIIYPSSAAYRGPWLIEFARLVELDSIVDELWNKMVEHRKNRIQEELAKTLLEKFKYAELKEEIKKDLRNGWTLGREERKLNVHLNSGKQVVGESFQEVAKERLEQNEVCTGFRLSLHCADVKSEIVLNQYSDDRTIRWNRPVSR